MRRPSVDPELLIRMLIVGCCFGIRSERRLCEEVHLWIHTFAPGPEFPFVNRTYPLMNASKSALMVSASVVGMPCGKPL